MSAFVTNQVRFPVEAFITLRTAMHVQTMAVRMCQASHHLSNLQRDVALGKHLGTPRPFRISVPGHGPRQRERAHERPIT